MKKRTNRIKLAAMIGTLAIMSSFILYGCGSGSSSKTSGSAAQTSTSKATTAVDVAKVADRLKDEIKYDDKLAEPEAETFDILYPDIPKDKVKAMKIYVSSSGGTAEEIACMEGTDEEAAKVIEEGLNNRIKTQKSSFENYVPEELKRLEKAFVIRKGNYVYLSVSNDPDKAKSIIEEN